MRVLIVNKFFYPRGGDCIAAINTASLLRGHGHDVGVFTMQFPLNTDTPGIIATAPEVDFTGGFAGRIAASRRMLGLDSAHRVFADALRRFRPDVVHLHNIHSYLNPALAREARRYGARVVWTMHDYKLLCPVYTGLRGTQTCLVCANGNHSRLLRHRCMKNSLAASVAAWFEAKRWNNTKLTRWVDTFICPSRFLAWQMTYAGFPESQLAVLHNFNPINTSVAAQREQYICYVGRIAPEKGVETLLKAVAATGTPLQIAGDGPQREALQQQYTGSNITWLGHLDADSVASLVGRAAALVIPSEWQENNPLSVIEALCAGTPVVATRVGGLPELVNTANGILVEPAAPDALAGAVTIALETHWDNLRIAQDARQQFSPENHYRQLIEIYTGTHSSHSPQFDAYAQADTSEL